MLPDLTVLLALLLGLMSMGGTPPDAAQALLGAALCVLVGSALSRMALGRGLQAIEDDDLVLAEVSARWTAVWPFLAWLGCVYLFDWGAWVTAAVPRTWWLGRYLVLFLPALWVFSVGWAGRARLESEIVGRRGGVPAPSDPLSGIRRALRRNAIITLPLLVLIGLTEGVWVLGELGVEPLRRAALWHEAMPLIQVGLMLALLLVVLPFIPWIFSRALKAVPLQDGRLRDILERAAASIDLRYRDIRVWRTGGRVFNAMVVGFTPGTRVVFLSDGLLNALSEDELLAVFFHEAGHAKRRHLPHFLVLFFAFSLLFIASAEALFALGISYELQVVLQLAILWFGLLGWVSRRFERESDIYGAEHASMLAPDAPPSHLPGLANPLPHGAELMVRALERIRSIVGTGRSHRHGSVEDRISYVAAHATDPEVRRRFERTRRAILVGTAVLLFVAVGATVLRFPTDVAHAEALIASNDGMEAYEEGWRLARADDTRDVARAPDSWRRAIDRFKRAAALLEGLTDRSSQERRILNLFNAADTALHGLEDREDAQRGFDRTLEALDEAGLRGPLADSIRFQCHVDLGRLAAWRYADLPPGHAERDLGVTLGHLETARTLRRGVLGSSDAFSDERRLYFDERLRLLAATYEAARGEHAEARRALRKLAQLGSRSGTRQRRDLQELAEDARKELDRLGEER